MSYLLSPDIIKPILTRLSSREWPDKWTSAGPDDNFDFNGWGHRYLLNPTLNESEVAAFEHRNEVRLPEEYRHFLLHLGNGGAGPHNGIYRLGMEDDNPVSDSILKNLAKWFLHQTDWDGPFDETHTVFDHPDFDHERYFSDDVMMGAMPICDQGSAVTYWLVVSGPARGQIWLDDRTFGNGIIPIENDESDIVSFGEWYLKWLQDAQSKWLA